MRVRGAERVHAIGERNSSTASHHPDTHPKRNHDAKDSDDDFDNVVVERQRQQIEGEIPAEHRIDHTGRNGAEEPHEWNPQRRREKSDQGREHKSNDPRRASRDDCIRPAQCAQVCADKQADQKRDHQKNRHAIFKRQPIATALAQLLKPVVFEGDAERRFKKDDPEDCNQNVGGIAIEAVYKRNAVAASL